MVIWLSVPSVHARWPSSSGTSCDWHGGDGGGTSGFLSNIKILVRRTNTQYLCRLACRYRVEDLKCFGNASYPGKHCWHLIFSHLTISAYAVNLDERILDLNLDNDLILSRLSSRSFHILGNRHERRVCSTISWSISVTNLAGIWLVSWCKIC